MSLKLEILWDELKKSSKKNLVICELKSSNKKQFF